MNPEFIGNERGASIVEILVYTALAAALVIGAYKVLGPLVLEAVRILGERINEVVNSVGAAPSF